MADLVRTFRDQYDIVIIDSPPLLPVTDAAVLSGCSDGVLLVVRSAKTSTTQVTGALRALAAVDARLLGCVLNMVPALQSEPYYYYGYGPRPATEDKDHADGTDGARPPAELRRVSVSVAAPPESAGVSPER